MDIKNNGHRTGEHYPDWKYPITVNSTKNGYSVEIVEIPGCCFEGENLQQLVEKVSRYKVDWIDHLYERGERIPVPDNEKVKKLEEKIFILEKELKQKKRRSKNYRIRLFWFFEQIFILSFGIAIGILLQLSIYKFLPVVFQSWEFAAITISGAFGGLLSSLNSKELKIPRINKQGVIYFGVFGEMLIGLGGAYTIFLLLPFDISSKVDTVVEPGTAIDFVNHIKIIAVGIIGGFSGNLITSRAADRVIQQLKKNDEHLEKKGNEINMEVINLSKTLQDKTKEANYLLERLNNDVRRVQEQSSKDADAFSLVIRHLDINHGLNSDDIELMKNKIKDASPSQKVSIFYHAKKIRGERWQKYEDREYMARTIPVFQGLIDSDKEKRFHRNYAQLGYALKDKINPDFEGAIKNISRAIDIRDNTRNQVGFGLYEVNRAVCRIMLDENFKESQKSDSHIKQLIHNDLIAACRDIRAVEQVPYEKTEPISEWLKLNEIPYDNFSFTTSTRILYKD